MSFNMYGKHLRVHALTFTLLCASSAGASASSPNPDDSKFRQALSIAAPYAAKHYKIGNCSVGDSRMRWSLQETPETLIADIGPKLQRDDFVRVTLRKDNLKVVKVQHFWK